MPTIRPRFMLQEPINWENLAGAYRLAKWKWDGGFPDAQRIHTFVGELKDTASKSGYCASGGITVKANAGECRVFIDHALYLHLPVDTPGSLDV